MNKPRRPRRNIPEAKLEQLALSRGWRATKKGWPDFICFDDKTGEIFVVEVKPRTSNGRFKRLHEDQLVCMDFLTSRGIPCFVSDGEVLEPYDPGSY